MQMYVYIYYTYFIRVLAKILYTYIRKREKTFYLNLYTYIYKTKLHIKLFSKHKTHIRYFRYFIIANFHIEL